MFYCGLNAGVQDALQFACAPHGVAVGAVMSVLSSSRSSQPDSAGSSRQIVRCRSLFWALDIDWTINPAAPTQLMISLLVFLLHASGDLCALTEFSLTFSAFLFHNLRLEAASSVARRVPSWRCLLCTSTDEGSFKLHFTAEDHTD